MAQTHSSATEYALENQRVGGLQIRVAVICGLIQMCDGYDVGTIGWSVPSLTHAWQIAPSAFALAFLWSNIGLMAGALAAGPIGDRIGRKPLLLISLGLLGLASLASAFSHEPRRREVELTPHDRDLILKEAKGRRPDAL